MQAYVESLLNYPAELADSKLLPEEKCAAILLLLALGRTADATKAFHSDTSLTSDLRRRISTTLNSKYLLERNLEWTNHGPQRTFRFWSAEEKGKYLDSACAMIAVLRDFSPHVSFGFGAVLGLIRDQDFIQHDDDLDILIAMEPMRFADAKERLRSFLHERGFVCHGENYTHFGVNTGKGRAVDVFIGFRQGERVSWFPSRRSSLEWNSVFPVQDFTYLGRSIPLPADAEAYLVATYGPDWREPDASWHHPWDIREYSDFS
jgi:hypothetical protein